MLLPANSKKLLSLGYLRHLLFQLANQSVPFFNNFVFNSKNLLSLPTLFLFQPGNLFWQVNLLGGRERLPCLTVYKLDFGFGVFQILFRSNNKVISSFFKFVRSSSKPTVD